MNFKSAAISGLKNWLDFSGRASRSEYWWFFLFYILVVTAFWFVIGIALFSYYIIRIKQGDVEGTSSGNWIYLFMVVTSIISHLCAIAMIIPGLSVSIRRLHDLSKSGWWILVMPIPIIGWILWIIWFTTRGIDGPNRFGPDPLLSNTDNQIMAN